MLLPSVPISKIGTPFQSPSWRYQATFNPEKFGFQSCLSKLEANSGCLSRLVKNGISPVATYNLPLYIRQLDNKLPKELYSELLSVWAKHYFKTRSKKVTFNINPQRSGIINWNCKKVKLLNDEFLQKVILHCFNIEGNEYVSNAIKFYKNKSNDLNCKWLKYSIYGGKSDRELALQWQKPVKFIEAIRLLFFDYSGWPKDKLVQYSLIRQTASNGELDEPDYHAFKRIFDLGDVGLRSILGHQTLEKEEQEQVKLYLAGAGVDNLLDQRFAITNLKESVSFNKSIAEYANIGLRRIEMEQKAAIMRLTAAQLEKNLGIEENTEIYSEDTELMEGMRAMMSKESPRTFPSIIDVKSELVSIGN